MLPQHQAKPETNLLLRGLVFFHVVLALVFVRVLLVYESALFKARAHTEMPVLVLFYI